MSVSDFLHMCMSTHLQNVNQQDHPGLSGSSNTDQGTGKGSFFAELETSS